MSNDKGQYVLQDSDISFYYFFKEKQFCFASDKHFEFQVKTLKNRGQ